MIKKSRKYLKLFGLLVILIVGFSTGCASLNPGTEDDPGEAVGAPTEPEIIREGYEEGAQNPEESF
ncbi:MAG: hypothetical protein DHS20C13_15800 [Thermodesulfobacteriota bacterium]|nr:MAG: hypothetical protein DHS20C13_15800 [Thermodesulfobacteriota bacterium]